MSLILGIDTGGTYTDGIVIDRAKKEIIAKAKALTTREDLHVGISKCIDNMDFTCFSEISAVSLSTTLATNAIVEGHGCEVGVIMIGFAPNQPLPASEVCMIPGGHTTQGKEKEPFEEAAAREAIESLRGKVEAIAISSYLSVRNPEHELATQKLVREILDVPVVCGHCLTRSLGMQERTVTAVLNARLIPIIKELLHSVKTSLAEKNIHAPIMVVKGDGSLMGEEQAENNPIETLLSGPASSIIGATFLAGEPDAMVMDMGGTTTDVAVLKNGIPRIDEEGASVGGWLTRVEAAAISTFGLGGDSYIQMDINRCLKIGPQRVCPFTVMSSQYPHLREELRSIHLPHSYLLVHSQVTDCFVILADKCNVQLDAKEEAILATLRDGPHSFAYLAHVLQEEMSLLSLDRLVNIGVLGRISVTPTDILHVKGDYRQWDVEGAEIAVGLLAQRFQKSREEFVGLAVDAIANELVYDCLQSLTRQEGQQFNLREEVVAHYFIGKQLNGSSELLDCSLRPKIPIIGLGAPAAAWLPLMAKKLNADLIIPEHPEVANAVGSATGKIMETVEVLIHPGEYGNGFTLHSSWEKRDFSELAAAKEYALSFAAEKAEALARANGAAQIEVNVHHEDVYAQANMIENDIYIETHVEAVATERPDWERKEQVEKFFVDTRDHVLCGQ